MKFLNESIEDAVQEVVQKDLGEHGGIGGVIAIDDRGNGGYCR